MKTNRAKLLVLAVFALTLGAGVVSGFLAARAPGVGATPVIAPTANASLAEKLELSPDQRQKMQAIWEGVRDLADQSLKTSQMLNEQRDDAVRALIPADKISQYNDALKKCQDENAKLEGNRRAAFDEAVKKTKGILSPAQQKKYSEILAQRLGGESAASDKPVGEAAGPDRIVQPSF